MVYYCYISSGFTYPKHPCRSDRGQGQVLGKMGLGVCLAHSVWAALGLSGLAVLGLSGPAHEPTGPSQGLSSANFRITGASCVLGRLDWGVVTSSGTRRKKPFPVSSGRRRLALLCSLGAGALLPGSYFQTPLCRLVKRPRMRGLLG